MLRGYHEIHERHDCHTLITPSYKSEIYGRIWKSPDLLSLRLDQVLSFRDLNCHYDSPADLIYQRFTTERKVETHILSVIEDRSANEYHWLRLFVREGDDLIISLIHRRYDRLPSWLHLVPVPGTWRSSSAQS